MKKKDEIFGALGGLVVGFLELLPYHPFGALLIDFQKVRTSTYNIFFVLITHTQGKAMNDAKFLVLVCLIVPFLYLSF